MILGDHGPTTQMEEDLRALGMEHLLEGAGTGKKKKSDDDQPAAPRQPISVRSEDDDDDDDEDLDLGEEYGKGKGKKKNFDFGKKKDDGDDEDEDDDDEDMDEDEDEIDLDDLDEDETEALRNALVEYAQGRGFDREQYEAMLEDGEFVTEFAQHFFSEDDDEDDEVDEDDDPQVEAAYEVIKSFQAQLSAFSESEDEDDKPEYDDLVGVIEAYEYLAEAQKGMKRAEKKDKRKKKMRKMTATGQLVAKTGAERRAQKRAARFFSMGKAARGAGKAHKAKSTRRAARLGRRKKVKGGKVVGITRGERKTARMASHEEPTGDPISELVQNLNDLREAVTKPQAEDNSEQLIDGLRAIHETATVFYERIANELNEGDEDEIEEDDVRVAMGRHLEKIAEDARAVAEVITEGTADLEDAADDLQALAADLDEAMDAMKGID